jgi:hypothetical protein
MAFSRVWSEEWSWSGSENRFRKGWKGTTAIHSNCNCLPEVPARLPSLSFRPCSYTLPQTHHSATRSSSFCMCVRASTYVAFCPRLRLSAGLPAGSAQLPWLPVDTYLFLHYLASGIDTYLPPSSFPSVIELAFSKCCYASLRPTRLSQPTYPRPLPNHLPYTCPKPPTLHLPSANSALPDPRIRNALSPQISHPSASQSRDCNAQKPCQTCQLG